MVHKKNINKFRKKMSVPYMFHMFPIAGVFAVAHVTMHCMSYRPHPNLMSLPKLKGQVEALNDVGRENWE
jgi:hypothetical protein